MGHVLGSTLTVSVLCYGPNFFWVNNVTVYDSRALSKIYRARVIYMFLAASIYCHKPTTLFGLDSFDILTESNNKRCVPIYDCGLSLAMYLAEKSTHSEFHTVSTCTCTTFKVLALHLLSPGI